MPPATVLVVDDDPVILKLLEVNFEMEGFQVVRAADGAEGLKRAREVLPDVGELEWIGVRAGLRPGTPNNLPIVEPGGLGGLVWATGHYRNGPTSSCST